MKRLGVPLIIASAASALVFGVFSGLQRVGVALPMEVPRSQLHGMFMVSGFLLSLISLERAVALSKRWAFAAPILAAAGALLGIVGGSAFVASIFALSAALVLFVVTLWAIRRHPVLHHWVMALGSACVVIGDAFVVCGKPAPMAVPWWIGFLLLTIVAERLELARVTMVGSRIVSGLISAVAVFFIGTVLSSLVELTELASWGSRLIGAAMFVIALWMLRYDITRKTVRMSGLPRFIALSLMCGYGWLLTAGVLLMSRTLTSAGPFYDAVLHSFFLGFVFSMIFGHAPVIFPAVFGVNIPFRGRFYLHVGLLHLGLAVRVIGDLLLEPSVRALGGALNASAIALFMVNTLGVVLLTATPGRKTTFQVR